MKNTFSITAVALLSYALGIASVVFLLPLWVYPVTEAMSVGSNSDWIGFAGSIAGNLLTAIVAVGAALYAWKSVSEQIRQARESVTISIIIREEDRIERMAPGLLQAAELLGDITREMQMVPPSHFFLALEARGLSLDPDQMTAEIERRLPSTDSSVRHQVTNGLNHLVFRAAELHRVRLMAEGGKTLPKHPELTSFAEEAFQILLRDLINIQNSLHQAAFKGREKLPIYRRKIDAWLTQL